MKKNVLVLVITIITMISCDKKEEKSVINKSFNVENHTIVEDTTKYRIVKIDSIRNVYVYYAYKKPNYYKIVSSKDSVQSGCNRIKINHNYDLKLNSLLFPEGVERTHVHVTGTDYSGVLVSIHKEQDSIRDIYDSVNINGLCYKD